MGGGGGPREFFTYPWRNVDGLSLIQVTITAAPCADTDFHSTPLHSRALTLFSISPFVMFLEV